MAASEGLSLRWSTVEEAHAAVDPAALVALYARVLYRVAYSILRSPAEAEDVVQETFVRVLEHQHHLPEIRDLRVWLVRIAWNLALDRRRRVRPEQLDDLFLATLASLSKPVDQALAEAEQSRRALAEIECLPRLERAVLLLSAIDELETREIASVLGKSESAVRALLFRARNRLRQRLSQKETRR